MRLFSVQHVQLILACACVLIIGGICAVTYLVLATKKTVSVFPRPASFSESPKLVGKYNT